MEDCTKCDRKNTKYRCIGCKIAICNECSVACSVETPGYCEERYYVGKCDECQSGGGNSRKQEVSGRSSVSKPSTSSLTSYFRIQSKIPVTAETKIVEPQDDSRSGKLVQKSLTTSTSTSAKKSHNLSAATANRWKSTVLAQHMANEWLIINVDKAANETSLNCSVCKTFAEKLKGLKNFSPAWAFTGSTNLRLSNAEDHVRGEPHKRAMDFHLKEAKGQSVSERAESMKAANEDRQELITTGIMNMQESDRVKTKIKFEVAYFVAKSELPLISYPELLKLEEKHGVEIGNSYRNNMSCNIFINHIGEELGRNLLQKLSNAKFYSVLTDGSEDVSISEKEAVFVQYLNTNPPGRDTVQVVTSFLSLVDMKNGCTAADIVQSIRSSFQSINVSDDCFENKLIGFAADGATVNRGNREGVIFILQRNLPWVIYVWCVAHRLELSLKDALKSPCFDAIDEVLLRLYYLYKNSPKKVRQLRDLHAIYRETFEFEEGGVRPKRASGTRWITHKINALQMLVDKYGVYIQHLQNMSEDKTFKAVDRQKFKGWLRKWQQARIPLLSCLFIEILSPAKVLSLAFQGEDIDTVSSISRIETAKKQLERLKKKNLEDLPTVKRFFNKVDEANGEFLYQNVALHSFQAAKDSAREAKDVLLERITQALETRLEVAENRYVIHAASVLNTEGWEKKNEDEDLLFADNCVTELYDHFQVRLSKAGLDCSFHDLLEQWHSLVEYTKRYLNTSQTPYLRVWRQIFDSANRKEWNMVLILVELLFSIPISNAKVERLFSLMKRVKTDSRASLNESTLNNLIRICAEGQKFEDYDPTPAMQLWSLSAIRRPQQVKRKQYKSRITTKKAKVLIDESSSEDVEDEDEDEEDEVDEEESSVPITRKLRDLQ